MSASSGQVGTVECVGTKIEESVLDAKKKSENEAKKETIQEVRKEERRQKRKKKKLSWGRVI